jgi:hypothetical protein
LGTLCLATISPLCKIAALQRSRPITHATADTLGMFFLGSIATRLCSFFWKIAKVNPIIKQRLINSNLTKNNELKIKPTKPDLVINFVFRLFWFGLGKKQRLFFSRNFAKNNVARCVLTRVKTSLPFGKLKTPKSFRNDFFSFQLKRKNTIFE